MPRLFVALRPPQPVRARLIGMMGGVSGARWQSDDQLHLSLRFVGEVDRHVEADLIAALRGIHHPRFEIAIDRIGSFERRGETETLWAGVAPQDQLRALAKKVDQACRRAGLAPEGRAYAPHITLARLKRGAGPIRHLLEAQGGLSSPPFPVESFGLFESDLTPAGALYHLVERFGLD